MSQIKYLSPIKYLLAIMSLSERSADNTLDQANEVFVCKINDNTSTSQIKYLSPINTPGKPPAPCALKCNKSATRRRHLVAPSVTRRRRLSPTVKNVLPIYFGLGQSSICLKDQVTILRLRLIKHLKIS